MVTDDLVSIIVTTYYRNQYLRGCLQSVFNQDYRPIEVIVVDDSGEAYAREVIDAFDDITYVALDQNRGAQAARNRGVKRASGAYVQFLDDDDRLTRDKIRRQMSVLRENPNVGVVTCGIEYESGWVECPPETVRSRPLEEALAFNNLWRYSTLLIRYPALREVMPLDEQAIGGGDAKLGIELARRTEHDFVDAPLVQAGEPDRRLGASWAALETLQRMINEYEQLYDEADSRVIHRACANINRLEGRLILQENSWSGAAITAYAKAVSAVPGYRKLTHGAELLASLFGRPGIRIGSRILTSARARRSRSIAGGGSGDSAEDSS